MSIYDLAMSVAAFLIAITMFARLNDLRPDVHKSPIWWVRRIAFAQVIGACTMVMFAPVATNVPHWKELTDLMVMWGVFWVFFTSPYQKPWWELIVGVHRKQGSMPFMDRVRLELGIAKQGFQRSVEPDRRSSTGDRRAGGMKEGSHDQG